MSKSLKRVIATLAEAGLDAEIVELGDTRTARAAAEAVGCDLDQIAKSIVFGRPEGAGGGCALFLTAGGNRVDPARASALAGGDLDRVDASVVRAITGFAIGGVAPIGHLTPGPAWMDPRLMEFDRIWAAAGTPTHVFGIGPPDLARVSGATIAGFAVEET